MTNNESLLFIVYMTKYYVQITKIIALLLIFKLK